MARLEAVEFAPASRPAAVSRGSISAVARRLLGRDASLAWVLVLPVVAILGVLLAYPFVDAIILSFQDRFIGKTGTWVGVQNYVDLFSNPNRHFWQAAWNTVVFVGGAIVGKFVVGLAMACVLNQDLPGRNLLRGLMFLPWAVPAVVSAYAWRFIYDDTGPINASIAAYQLRDDYLLFFNDPKLAMGALITVVIWSGTPFWTMNFLAAMQAVSQELYEAAEIDGAGTLQRFRFITLPSIQPVLLVTTMLSTIWTSANLTQIFVLTGGGPNYATITVPLLSYLIAIPGKQLGAGAAASMLMVPAYLVLVYFLTRRLLEQE
jgi:multiple sugar transport system permease protein